MSRKKPKEEHYRVGTRLHTEHIDSVVILNWVDIAINLGLSQYDLIEEAKKFQNEDGIHLEYISKKNKLGHRIHVLERKYVVPGTMRDRDPEKWYGRIDDYMKREYIFFMEHNGLKLKNEFIALNYSDDTITQMTAMLTLYKSGCPDKKA